MRTAPVDRRAAGVCEEFDAFYAATAPSLVRQVHAFCGDLPEAQDCVQEAFARAWQRWAKVGTYDVPAAWVRQVACRLAVSRFRRAQLGRRLSAPAVVPALDADRVALVAALKQLPEAQRLAIVLHHVADLSVEQVAAEVGAPVGTVKARLARGRATLAQLLSDSESSS